MVNQCPMLFNSNLFPRESCLKGKLDCHSSLLLSNFRRKFKLSIVSKALPKHITCADQKMTLYPCNMLGFLFTSRWSHRASWHLHGPFKRKSELFTPVIVHLHNLSLLSLGHWVYAHYTPVTRVLIMLPLNFLFPLP